jgi:hypothetical protein
VARVLAWLERFLNRVCTQSFREHQVAEFETISIADYRNAGEAFASDAITALELILANDTRRFRRVQETCRYIVNHVIPSGAPGTYDRKWSACLIDYDLLRKIEPTDFRRGAIACLLVHEATHGIIENREIRYVGDNRLRIERLCMAEQNRFALRLFASAPNTYSGLNMNFEESDWTSRWSRSRAKVLLSYVCRYLKNDKVQD